MFMAYAGADGLVATRWTLGGFSARKGGNSEDQDMENPHPSRQAPSAEWRVINWDLLVDSAWAATDMDQIPMEADDPTDSVHETGVKR